MPSYTYGDPSTDFESERALRHFNDPAPLPVKHSASALQREWAGLQADVQELVANPALKSSPEMDDLKQRLQNSLHRASEAVADASHGITQRVRHTAAATNDYVHEQPWKVASIAMLAGVVIGFLAATRR
ncbi:hypothetical protein OOT46_02145 [Aquabacterium sp. A7-Y]|uniref:DUF883 family protein n=1 Tax=Aquabacterium sp. A7-Y TaxID=1349605 RepID=UPI00223D041C|nr:hypothetical protein [Aquabacterium sp. A7-Y]MCW7536658.1 hypothetical protein [Aquabacterium sp. A7-Y]